MVIIYAYIIIYRLPPLPPTPNNFDELMFGWIDDEEYGILFKGPSWEPVDSDLETRRPGS